MTIDAPDPRLEYLKQLTAEARTGRQREIIPALLDLVNGDDALSAWIAADVLAAIMAWIDFVGAASDMVERIVLRFGHLTEAEQLPPPGGYLAAVVAGGLYEGTEVVPRLLRMADVLPPDDTLRNKLLFAAGRQLEDPTCGLPLSLGEPRALPRFQQRLEAKKPKKLRADELHALWHAYTSASRRDGLIRLYDAGCPVPEWNVIEWRLAESLYESRRPADAEAVLLASRAHFLPFLWWQTLPHSPILNPGLRRAVTPRVKEAHLTLPVCEPL